MIALLLDENLMCYEQDFREILMAFFPGEPFCYEKKPEAGLFVCADKSEIRLETPEQVGGRKEESCRAEGYSRIENGSRIDDGSGTADSRKKAGSRCRKSICLSESRKENKTRIKRALYELLSEFTGEQLPWGTLTGIRPVKLADILLLELEKETNNRDQVEETKEMPGPGAQAIQKPEKVQKIQELEKAQAAQKLSIDARAASILKKHYLISSEKTALMLDIAHREREVLSRLDYRNGYSLYIGIPFCPTTCLYCSFTSYPIAKWTEHVDEYLECLRMELRQVRKAQEKNVQSALPEETEQGKENEKDGGTGILSGKALQTVYVGGGTPTSLSAEHLRKLLEIVREELDLCAVSEFTVEAGRPDSITPEKLRVLKEFGIDRISINPQTMNQKTLDLIGRRHTVEDVKRAFYEAREAGFDNINMDLIMGLPEETVDDVRHTLSEIEEMKPESLTVHALAVKRAARLNIEGNAWAHLARAGKEEASLMTELGAESAACMGLFPYYLYRQKNMAGNQENVGYAAPGKENLYNILMMEERHTVIGCGAGASSKAVFCGEPDGAESAGSYRVERNENIKNIAEYLQRFPEVLEKKWHFLGV